MLDEVLTWCITAFIFVITLQLIVTALTSRFRTTSPLFDFAKRIWSVERPYSSGCPDMTSKSAKILRNMCCSVILFLLGFTNLMFAYSSAFKEAHYVYHEPPPM